MLWVIKSKVLFEYLHYYVINQNAVASIIA